MNPEDLRLILDSTAVLLGQAHNADESAVKPTDFYNEGWLAALTLSIAASGVDLLPFRLAPGARWWSEALLRSPFNPRQRGDRAGEGLTNADALVGHFDRRPGTKRGISVRPDATQLVLVEAKLGARLTPMTKNAAGFDQVARSLVCMAWELQIARVDRVHCTSLGLYVLAPQESLDRHRTVLDRASIEAKVRSRLEQYDAAFRAEAERCFAESFSWLLANASLECVAWETIIKRAREADEQQGRMLNAFYQQCRLLM